MNKYDVVIIGSGPMGMSAAINLKRAGINPIIIEKSSPGGQMNRTSIIENYPGIKTDGPTLSISMYNQINELGIEYEFDEVVCITKNKTNIKVETKNKIILTKYLIIASGRSPKKLNIRNISELENRGISYCAICDGALFKNLDVIVVGGGAVATEEAIYLSKICKSVTILNRSSNYKETVEKVVIKTIEKIKNLKTKFNSEIKSVERKENKLVVTLNTNETLIIDGIFVCIGYVPNTSFIDNIKKNDDYLVVNKNYETSVKKIYAGGDVIKKDMYQIVGAVYEGSIIANKIQKLLSKH